MTTHLSLHDDTLRHTAVQLSAAATLLSAAPPAVLPSPAAQRVHFEEQLTGYLSAVETARRALVDAAHQTSLALATLMAQHSELDQHLAAATPSAHALPAPSPVTGPS